MTAPVRVIPPDAVFRLAELRVILGVPATMLKREARSGRLRVSRRGTFYWTTGRWVHAWLEAGEVRKGTSAEGSANA
jgi:hypothetical protein